MMRFPVLSLTVFLMMVHLPVMAGNDFRRAELVTPDAKGIITAKVGQPIRFNKAEGFTEVPRYTRYLGTTSRHYFALASAIDRAGIPLYFNTALKEADTVLDDTAVTIEFHWVDHEKITMRITPR